MFKQQTPGLLRASILGGYAAPEQALQRSCVPAHALDQSLTGRCLLRWAEAGLCGTGAAWRAAGAAVDALQAVCAAGLARARQPGACCAVLAAEPGRHCSGYRMHPALLDATLHLAAAAVPRPAQGASPGPTRVPVGAAAFAAAGAGAHGGALFPAALPLAPAADGSAVCEYALAGPGGAVAAVHGLLTRTLPAPTAQPSAAGSVRSADRHAAALEQASQPASLLYEPEWQAHTPLAPPASRPDPLRPPRAATFDLARGLRPRGAPAHARGSPALTAACHVDIVLGASAAASLPAAAVVARALEAWHCAAAAAPSAVTLLTAGASPAAAPQPAGSGRAPAAAGAALWALARVAAAENPGIRVGGNERSPLSGRARRGPLAFGTEAGAEQPDGLRAADAFGRAQAGGLLSVARLMRSRRRVEAPDCHVMPCPRGALADLRMVPLPRAEPGPGEVKVGLL